MKEGGRKEKRRTRLRSSRENYKITLVISPEQFIRTIWNREGEKQEGNSINAQLRCPYMG